MSKSEKCFLWLAGVFVSALIISNIVAVKLISLGSVGNLAFFVPVAVFLYAITFPITDVISEIWGKARARAVVWTGFGVSLFASLCFQMAILIPAAPVWEGQEAFAQVLGPNLRVTVAALLAYILSQTHDVWAFHFWKRVTAGRHLWLRNTASTAVSQLLDTSIFITLAFAGSGVILWQLILAQYLVKLAIAVLDTPVVYLLVWWIRQYLNREKEKEHVYATV